MSPKHLLILLVLTVSLLRAEETTKNETEITPSAPAPIKLKLDVALNQKLQPKAKQTYEADIDKTKADGDWNLFFLVDPSEKFSWERTTIKVYKLDSNKAEVFSLNCSESGVDTCMIPRTKVSDNDKIYAQVTCEEECVYSVKVYWSETYPLRLNSPFTLDFETTAYAKLFTVNVQDKNLTFQELRIILRAKTFMLPTQPVKMYVNYGTTPPTSSKHDFEGIHLWDDGMGVFIRSANMKQRLFTVLVEGPAENVLELTAQTVEKHNHTLSIGTPFFDMLEDGNGRSYRLDLKTQAKTGDVYFKIQTFTGEVNATLYRNKELTQEINAVHMGFVGMSQFKLSEAFRTAQKIEEEVYVRVLATDSDATFLVLAFIGEVDQPMKLPTDMAVVSELKSGDVETFYHESLKLRGRGRDNFDKNQTKIKFIIHQLQGTVKPVFTICKDDARKCSIHAKSNYKDPKFVQLTPTEVHSVGSDFKEYTLVIENKLYHETDSKRVHKATILALLIGYEKENKYSMEVSDSGIMRRLNQRNPLKERMSKGEIRYYRALTMHAADISAINIHMVDISGLSEFLVYREDPRYRELDLDSSAPTNNHIRLTDKLDKPVYIVVNAKQNCLFTLNLNIERRNRNETSSTKFDVFTLARNLEEEIKVGPGSTVFVQLSPNNMAFNLVVSSPMNRVDICSNRNLTVKPIKPNCESELQLTNGTLEVGENKVTKMNIGIHNPHDKDIVVKAKWYYKLECEEVKLGAIWNKKSVAGEKKIHCLKFLLTKHEDLEVNTYLPSLHYENLKILALVEVSMTGVNPGTDILTKSELDKWCSSTNKTVCDLSLIISGADDSDFSLVAQYVDEDVVLLDGIAHETRASIGYGVYKYYKFRLDNKINTTVMVEGKTGFYNFFCKIVEQSELRQHSMKIYPTDQSFDFKSQNDYYSRFTSLSINQENITGLEKCKKNNSRCWLLISVTINNNSTVEENGKLYIQVAQEQVFIKEKSTVVGHLFKHSVAYYRYYLPNDSRNVMVGLNTQNKKCARIYLARDDRGKASASNYVAKSEGSEVVHKGDPGTYLITVQATQDCSYTITASSSTSQIYELTSGVFKDMILKVNQTVYLYYHNSLNQSFKLLSLENYGELLISANQTNAATIKEIDTLKNSTSKFDWSEQKNVLIINPNDKGFCVDCYYLFEVKALKDTETSFIISTPGVEIPLNIKRQVTDRLDNGDKMAYRVYAPSHNLTMDLYVHTGEVTIQALGQDNYTLTRTFNASPIKQVWNYDSKGPSQNNTGYYWSQPVILKLTALSSTMYSMRITSENADNQTQSLKSGIPTYAYLTQDQNYCLEGTTHSGVENIIMSVSHDDQQYIYNISYQVKVNQSLVQVSRENLQNSELLSFNSTNSQPTKFRLCLKSPKSLSVTIVATGAITLFPEGFYLFFKGQQNLSLSPTGKTIVQVFECSGEASVLFNSKFSKLAGEQSDILHWRRFGQNYLYEFQHYGPLYMNLDGTKTSVRWLSVNQSSGTGLGYYYLRTPHFKYHITENNQIEFRIPQIKKVRPEYKLNVTRVRYTIMVASSHHALKKTANCNNEYGNTYNKTIQQTYQQQYTGDKTNTFIFNVTHSQYKHTFFYFTQKEEIKKHVQDIQDSYIYVTVVGSVYNYEDHQEQVYRFVYDEEKISLNAQPVMPEQQEAKPAHITLWEEFKYMIIGALLVVLGFFVAKWGIQKLRKRRAQSLMEPERQDVELKYATFTSNV